MSPNGNDAPDKTDEERTRQRRINDSLQGGEGNSAYGEDARDFGAGGQRDQRPLEPGHEDSKDRDLDRDATVPTGAQSGGAPREL